MSTKTPNFCEKNGREKRGQTWLLPLKGAKLPDVEKLKQENTFGSESTQVIATSAK